MRVVVGETVFLALDILKLRWDKLGIGTGKRARAGPMYQPGRGSPRDCVGIDL